MSIHKISCCLLCHKSLHATENKWDNKQMHWYESLEMQANMTQILPPVPPNHPRHIVFVLSDLFQNYQTTMQGNMTWTCPSPLSPLINCAIMPDLFQNYRTTMGLEKCRLTWHGLGPLPPVPPYHLLHNVGFVSELLNYNGFRKMQTNMTWSWPPPPCPTWSSVL